MASKVEVVIDGKNKAGPAFKEANKQLGDISSQAKAAGAAIVAALSVSAVSSFIQNSIDAADAAGKSAQATGLLVDEYTALKYAAELAGVGTEKLDGALGKFNKTIDGAAQGGKSQTEAFKRLGISVRDAEGNVKTSGALLAEVADKFQQLPDGVQKSALAMQLFGKSGAAMIPLLNEGAAGLAEMRKEAEALGVVIGPEMVARSEVFNDNLTKISQAADGAANGVTADLLPSLVSLSELMVDLNKNTGAASVIGRALGGVLKVMTSGVLTLGAGFQILGSSIAAAAAEAVAIAKGDFAGAADILRQARQDNMDTFDNLAARIDNLWSGQAEAAAEAAVALKNTENKIAADAAKNAEELTDQQKKLVAATKDSLAKRVAMERDAARQLDAAKKAQLDTEKRYKDALAQLSAGSSGEASYGQAQALKVSARQSAQAGDAEGAKLKAQAALKQLQDIAEKGGNTYGFAGFIEELHAIETSADKISVDGAEASLKAAKDSAAQLKAELDAIKDVKINPELDPSSRAKLVADMQALAAEIGQTLTIPVQMVAVAPVGTGSADASQLPGHARGGHIRGPGTGTSDSILARLSNGEFVMRAAAVRAYGPALLEKMNGLRIPKFADGGMIGAAMSAPVGQAGRDLGRVDLNIGGETISLLADQQNFADLVKRQSWKRGSTRR